MESVEPDFPNPPQYIKATDAELYSNLKNNYSNGKIPFQNYGNNNGSNSINIEMNSQISATAAASSSSSQTSLVSNNSGAIIHCPTISFFDALIGPYMEIPTFLLIAFFNIPATTSLASGDTSQILTQPLTTVQVHFNHQKPTEIIQHFINNNSTNSDNLCNNGGDNTKQTRSTSGFSY
ncbi:hypothetical protein ACTA71_008216 [Dictyostelium dimigraforme]